mgnify:CR=1 FL=1
MKLKISGDLETIWCETLDILRHFHQAVSKERSRQEADLFIDALAILGKLSDEEIEEYGEDLLVKFLAERNSNN